MKRFAIICAFTMTLVGCSDSQPEPPQPKSDHPLLQGLNPPPVNKPVRSIGIKLDTPVLKLSSDTLADILVIQNDKVFRGNVQHTGTVSIDKEAINFELAKDKPVRILYRLPKGMSALPGIKGDAQLQVRALTTPEGADQLITLRQMDKLLFSNVWQRSKQPLRIPLTGKLYLMQAPATKLKGAGYTEAEVALFEGDKLVAKFPIGKTISVKTSVGPLQVYIETSHRFIPTSNDADQYPDEYILHAWITQSEVQSKPVE